MAKTMEQRAADLRDMLGRYRITIKDVCTRADLNYNSIRNNLRRLEISNERMNRIEAAAVEIRDEIIIKRRGR